MCGRFALSPKTNSVEKLFPESEISLENINSYNICPTMDIVGITLNTRYNSNLYRWGWTLNNQNSSNITLFNARAESLMNKKIYREVMNQRVVIPATAYYEWSKGSSVKNPYCIKFPDDDLFGFAGLYRIEAVNNQLLSTISIITCPANELISSIHNRMPVILDSNTARGFLNPNENIEIFTHPYSPKNMIIYPVSRLVNSPNNNSPECLIETSDDVLKLF